MTRISCMLAAAVIAATSFNAAADNCGNDCGKVVSVDAHKQEGEGTGLGAVAGGVVGGLLGNQVGGGTGKTIATIGGVAGGAYAGHVAEKHLRSKEVFVVTVQMDDGKTHHYNFASVPGFAAGDRVQVVNGKPVRYTGN